jgi:DNA primase large subunit
MGDLHRPQGVDPSALFAEFPFLPGAESLVAEYGATLRELLTDPAYARTRELARTRILAALDDPTAAPGVAELAIASSEARYLSFVYARLLLSTLPAKGALRRWAVAEAKGASARLHRGPELREVATRLGYELEEDRSEVRVRVADYLKLATPIREGEFRLARQGVRAGWVHLKPERAARLLQEGIRVELSEPVPIDAAARAAVAESEGLFLEEVGRRAPTPMARLGPGVGPLRPEFFPPCIRMMRRTLQAGENLSHAGRFALAAFLHRAGASQETLVDAYRGAPDFDEGITRYQVEHITRHNGGVGYEPPECAKLRSHGLCFREGDPKAATEVDRQRDPLCFDERLRHPMQYYRWRGGVPVDRSPDSAGEPSAV